ncbi:hypothetical protein BGW80DRAFT_1334567 [Lactifluus volemus]|nr:hypothetical protein BGW80DRAFT_1334567 [Lactifluus volemus]
MSCSVSTLAGPPQSQSVSNVLGPGIAGLFIHGLVTGLVIAQFARWFSASKRDDSVAFTALIVFVTVVGLMQSGIYFASTWVKYVDQFGQNALPVCTITHPASLTWLLMPLMMIWRCYYIVGENIYIIVSFASYAARSTLITTFAMSLRSIVILLHIPETVGISYFCEQCWPN